jgi:hypothetical protein
MPEYNFIYVLRFSTEYVGLFFAGRGDRQNNKKKKYKPRERKSLNS